MRRASLAALREPRCRVAPCQAGLTLVELLVVLVVAGLLLGWAAPGFQSLMARQEVAAEVHRIKVALALARNTAITRRTEVFVCPSPDLGSCSTNDWSAPLAIVLGPLAGETYQEDALLRVVDAGRGVSVSYSRNSKRVRYGPLGRPAGYNGTFRICGRHDSRASVVVSNFGRVRVGDPPSCP